MSVDRPHLNGRRYGLDGNDSALNSPCVRPVLSVDVGASKVDLFGIKSSIVLSNDMLRYVNETRTSPTVINYSFSRVLAGFQ